MIELILLAAVVYVVAVVQTVFSPSLAVGGVMPDLFAVATALWVVHRGGRGAVYVSAAIGLVADLVSAAPTGVSATVFALCAYGLLMLKTRQTLVGVLPRAAATFVSAAAMGSSVALAHLATGQTAAFSPAIALQCLGAGIYTAAVALPALLAFQPWPRPRRRLSMG